MLCVNKAHTNNLKTKVVTSKHLLVQSQQWKHLNNMWNLLKFNIKDSKTVTLASFWCLYCSLWADFTYFTGVSIDNFELVAKYAGWQKSDLGRIKSRIEGLVENNIW